jgi:queuosine precursor transporter
MGVGLPQREGGGTVNGRAVFAFAAFVACVVAANWLTNRYGFVPVGFGLTATAGTYAAGLSFGVRDALSETADRWWVVLAIVCGAALSYLVAPSLAVASGVAFLFSESADLAVYEPLRRRRWTTAVVASNVVGAVVDTVLFLWIAFGSESITRTAMAGQLVGKVWMILPALVLVGWVRRSR